MGNAMAAVSYVFGWFSGLVVFLIAGEDKVAKFHGLQSILFNIGACLLMFVVGIIAMIGMMVIGIIDAMATGGILTMIFSFAMMAVFGILGLAVFAFWVLCIWKAWKGEIYKLPLVGGLAEKWA